MLLAQKEGESECVVKKAGMKYSCLQLIRKRASQWEGFFLCVGITNLQLNGKKRIWLGEELEYEVLNCI